jgi:hypothetical protein
VTPRGSPDGDGPREIAWSGVVDVAYGTIVLADAEAGVPAPEDDWLARYMEECCGTLGTGLQVRLPERDAPVATEVRIVGDPGEVGPAWDHVAELGFRAPSGRVRLYSWMPDEDLAAELVVPTSPLRARIHWAGLEHWLQEGWRTPGQAPGPVHLRIDLFPGPPGGVETLRTWHFWAPPVYESLTPAGLRIFRGPAVAPLEAGLQLIPRQFWPPYPATEEGSVQALWRDPSDGSRWAHGSGPRGHSFLQELTPTEADALATEGFPPVRTYARDADGRIWSADQMPLERAPALLLIPPERWAMFQGLFTSDEVQVVDLPAGWSRITRRPFGGAGSPVLVGAPDGDGRDALYQRWPDGAEIPT